MNAILFLRILIPFWFFIFSQKEYELLNIIDFNNVRKRMSVILRRGDDIFLYCKGADNVIYDRLSSSQNDIKTRTQDHLNVSSRKKPILLDKNCGYP